MSEKTWEVILENWTAPIEIIILAIAIYYIYTYLQGTRGARILIGLALIVLTLTLISTLLNLVVISWLLRSFSLFFIVALVVIFQPELRRALTELGSHRFFGSAFENRETIEEITDTVFELAGKGFGALIAIEREISLGAFAETGVGIDCAYSKELVLTIFQPKTVLHDGGLILSNDRIVAAGCIFPLTLPAHAAGGSRSQPRPAPSRRPWAERGIRCPHGCRERGDRAGFHLPQRHHRAEPERRKISQPPEPPFAFGKV
jgi:diadenylate cyclase